MENLECMRPDRWIFRNKCYTGSYWILVDLCNRNTNNDSYSDQISSRTLRIDLKDSCSLSSFEKSLPQKSTWMNLFGCFSTGLQSQHLPAAALERPQAEASTRFQVRFSDCWPQNVQMSVETWPVLRQREERQLPWRHPGEHPPVYIPEWRRSD